MIHNWLMVQADLLSIQLLHDAGDEGLSDGTYSGEVFSVPLLTVLKCFVRGIFRPIFDSIKVFVIFTRAVGMDDLWVA